MSILVPTVFALTVVAFVVGLSIRLVVAAARAVDWERGGPIVFGVCRHWSHRLDVPPRGVRILTVVATLFTGVVPGLVAYVVAAVVLGGTRRAAEETPPRPVLLGLCADLAVRLGVPVDNVRLVVMVATLATGLFPGTILYVVAGLLKALLVGVVPTGSTGGWTSSPGPEWGVPGRAWGPLGRAWADGAWGGETALDAVPSRIGRYRIVGLLGRGGMGSVWRGRDDSLGRDAAVKVVDGPFGGEAVRRFGEEARAAAAIQSPHIVQIWEYAPDTRPPFLAMEFVPGRSLLQVVRTSGPQPAATAIDCAAQVLAGLAAAHARGIVHRDIKPANILLATSGPSAGTYKLTDFGLATSPDRHHALTATGTLLGTLSYLAPEVALGGDSTPSSDLYSLGATLHELVVGRPPLEAETPLKLLRRLTTEAIPPIGSLRPDLPADLAAWLDRLVARDPVDRHASAEAALQALRGVTGFALATTDLARARAPRGDDAVPWHHRPAPEGSSRDPAPRPAILPADGLHHVLGRALAIEAEGRDALGEDSILDIARELNIDPAAVRSALLDRRRRPGEGVTGVFRRALGGAERVGGNAREWEAFAADWSRRRGPGLRGAMLALGVFVGLAVAMALVFLLFAAREVEVIDSRRGAGGPFEIVAPESDLRVIPPGVVIVERPLPLAEQANPAEK